MTTTCDTQKSRHHRIMLADLQPGEQAFPIYRVSVRWTEAKDPAAEDRMHWAGDRPLPEGRVWNSTGWDTMFRVPRDLEEIEDEFLRDWWPKFAETRPEAADPDILVRFVQWEVWCESWFSHWTFDTGMDDTAVLASFGRYVDRVACAVECERYDGISPQTFCLSGAEDRWRWHGCVTGDPKGEHTPAPCRCPHCRKNGLVRIDH